MIQKILLVIALLLVPTLQVSDTEFSACLLKEGLTSCYYDAMESCEDIASVKDSSQCQYIQDNSQSDLSEWTEEYGENWHGCINNCLEELTSDEKECVTDAIQCFAGRLLALSVLAVGVFLL